MKLRFSVARTGWILAVLAGCGSNTTPMSDPPVTPSGASATTPAPTTTPPQPTVTLAGLPGAYKATFSEDFDGPLDVSPRGPGTRWIAHTPYNGDFGMAKFIDPNGDNPFSLSGGTLTIHAIKKNTSWTSGLLCSVDPQGNGFSQQYGYFEMRAQLPTGAGVWPAFWMLSRPALLDSSVAKVEIDAMEEYGTKPQELHNNLHVSMPNGVSYQDEATFTETGMSSGYHTYGVLVTASTIAFYFDRQKLREIATPTQAQVPLYILVDLAIDGSMPVDPLLNSASLLVDYVKVWAQVN